MKSKLARLASLVIVAVLLSACSTVIPSQPDRLMLGLTPTNELGYEVDDQGKITITTRQLVLSTKAGMPVTNVTGYTIEYYDELDVLVGSSAVEPQSLSITLPAGFVCAEPTPVIGCGSMSDGARPATGPAIESPALADQLLTGAVAVAHVAAGQPNGWYAVLTLYYDNARGSFQQEYILYIVVPN